jgi:hypothetical protein
MNWYKKAKLIDKDPSEKVMNLQCAWCKRFAIHNIDDPSDPKPVWKLLEELTAEEQNEAQLSLKAMVDLKDERGISHGLCPECFQKTLEEVKKLNPFG